MREIKLEPFCSSNDCQDLLAVLRSAVGEPVRCDGAGVDVLPTSLTQILLSAARTWSGSGGCFEVINLSELCAKKLQLLGVPRSDLSVGMN